MIKQILTQLENKTITVKLKDDGSFSGTTEIELQDFTIEYFLEAQGYFTAPERSTGYYGGTLESCDIDISDIVVFDSDGDVVIIDAWEEKRIYQLIYDNIEFE